jgi:Xaa-Pro aminopeptidase
VTRGFAISEYEGRVARAQALMARHDLAALLLSTEAEVRYFTGYLTRFWESPTRPWFIVLPAHGAPVAVIPSIGAALMAQTWITDIRTWRAPDPVDDGVSLLTETLNEVAGKGRIGVPSGPESHLRMPLADWALVQEGLQGRVTEDAGITARLRAVKSDPEIAKIAAACAVAGRAFDRVSEVAGEGVPLSHVFRDFQRLLLEEGADWVPYLAGGAGVDGYGDVISPATDAPLASGETLMLDTGAMLDGYFCDFDRNFAVGKVTPAVAEAHTRLVAAVDAAAGIAAPGATAADLFHAMDPIVTGGAGGSDAGRLGHGLGMQLTEGLSLIPGDHTVLEPGMVLTLEPGTQTVAGRMLVLEEDIVITDTGCRFLTPRAAQTVPVI